jgi:NAD(P)-dependent dehydrogenase (short-subunit alcohol dehydrogenase family)
MSKPISTAVLLGVGGLGAAWGMRSAARRRRRMDFSDKVVVIAGGSRGLGLVLARQLAQEGAHLALLARSREELDKAAAELEAYGGQGLSLRCDITVQEQVDQALTRVVEHYGGIDVLINNAGIIQVGPLEEMELDDFRQAMDTHFWGPLYASLAAASIMRQQGGGRIVNITSIGGQVAVPHLMPYSASKFALVGLSDAMRTELAKDNILVTTVTPGLMRTGSHVNALFKGQYEREFTWFSLSVGLPLLSTSAERAARKIIEACRYGDPALVITPQARLAMAANNLIPGLVALAARTANRLLPDPAPFSGESPRPGWQSQSTLSPSVFTRLADEAAVRNNQLQQIPRGGEGEDNRSL